MTKSFIRPYRASDREAVAQICLRTGDGGADATGQFHDDRLLADIYALPYVDRHPEYAFVVDLDGAAVGYVIAAPDTDAFNTWFAQTWWPSVQERYAPWRHVAPDERTIANAAAIGSSPVRYAALYPAHLHINLLPEAQGGGWGRRLIETELSTVRDGGGRGLHLVAAATNMNAVAFYERIGLRRLRADANSVAFGIEL